MNTSETTNIECKLYKNNLYNNDWVQMILQRKNKSDTTKIESKWYQSERMQVIYVKI